MNSAPAQATPETGEPIYDIAIIGAGPAGLALGTHLHGHANFVILERGNPGHTWHLVPRELKLLNCWFACAPDWRHIFAHRPWRYLTASEFGRYIDRYAAPLRGRIKQDWQVSTIQPGGAGQYRIVSTEKKIVTAKFVVCATGYYASPRLPAPDFDQDTSIPIIHTAQLRSYNELSSLGARVLIVGKRISAGQIALECHTRGLQVSLSTRGPISFSKDHALPAAHELLYQIYEECRIRAGLVPIQNSWPPMPAGRIKQLIENDSIRIMPRIQSVRDGQVIFIDGRHEKYDTVILATGYQPALDYLPLQSNTDVPPNILQNGHRFELPSLPGVFLLGFDNLINYRSRFLRGIRDDAGKLSRELLNRLSS